MYTCELPSGIKVSVEAPTFSHRMESLKEYRAIKDDAGYSVEELMAAKSIASINGKIVDNSFTYDPIYIMSDWPNADVQFYLEWYMTLFFIDDKVRDKATDAAKKLMIQMRTQNSKSPAAKA